MFHLSEFGGFFEWGKGDGGGGGGLVERLILLVHFFFFFFNTSVDGVI